MSTLDDLVRTGKVRFIGVSNFSGWQLPRTAVGAGLPAASVAASRCQSRTLLQIALNGPFAERAAPPVEVG